jgi:hypothetical protein
VVIIRDTNYLATRLGGDRFFIASSSDAYAARADVERYVWARMKRTKSRYQSFRWRQVLLKQPAYIWHCGGYGSKGSDFVYCTLSRYAKGLEEERFPDVADGGTDCRSHYSLKAHRIILLECNDDT